MIVSSCFLPNAEKLVEEIFWHQKMKNARKMQNIVLLR